MDTSVLVIVGATATGKSRLAIRLAETLGGEIVNGDALQVYRGFEIGTAKPTADERESVRHHLLDLLDPREPFSAGRFARLARRAIADIEARGRWPLVVGGSGLYVRTLVEGLSPIPETPVEVRKELQDEHRRLGLEAMWRRLGEVDPEACRRLAPSDAQRVSRALEVWIATGVPLSVWQQESPRDPPLECRKIGLTVPRNVLYDRIAARVDEMLEAGWVGEVQGLLDSGLVGSEPAFQAIGYSQIVDYLTTGRPLAEVRDEIVLSTRRYAKRQVTWFKRERGMTWFEALDGELLFRSVLASLEGQAVGGGDERQG